MFSFWGEENNNTIFSATLIKAMALDFSVLNNYFVINSEDCTGFTPQFFVHNLYVR